MIATERWGRMWLRDASVEAIDRKYTEIVDDYIEDSAAHQVRNCKC